MHGAMLSGAAYWFEDGLHVFRSTEYDVIAADEDKDTAARIFVEKSEDYGKFLAEPEGQPTFEDLGVATLIMSRLIQGYEAILAKRKSRNPTPEWHHVPAART